MNQAKYLHNGKVTDIPGDGAVIDYLYPIDFMPGFNLIGYPNRDSTQYAKIYGIENESQTVLRGTLRYQVYTMFFLKHLFFRGLSRPSKL